MKRLYVILFASLITLAVLSACGVEQTPATATDAPAPFSEAPETEEFATTIPVVGEDYTLSSVEISGAYTYISHGPIMKCLDECDVTRSVSKTTEIERRGGKRWDKPKKAGKSRDCRGGKF